jgi:tRNA (cytidine/uridine-2'-O-)-methyltransferase
MTEAWPQPPLQVALVEPEIPPNTGNVARLCAGTGCRLHLVGPLAFRLDDRTLRRAGLDYWDHVDMVRHPDLEAFAPTMRQQNTFFYSTRGARPYTDARHAPGDILVFGSETRGLPESLVEAHAENVYRIPMRADHVRSLNLSNAVAIVLYEALRQLRTFC